MKTNNKKKHRERGSTSSSSSNVYTTATENAGDGNKENAAVVEHGLDGRNTSRGVPVAGVNGIKQQENGLAATTTEVRACVRTWRRKPPTGHCLAAAKCPDLLPHLPQ